MTTVMNAARKDSGSVRTFVTTVTTVVFRRRIRARQLAEAKHLRHWEVSRARAIKIQLCKKVQLAECIEGGRDFVPC